MSLANDGHMSVSWLKLQEKYEIFWCSGQVLYVHTSRWWSRRTCSHLLLREHQNLNWMLNSHWQGAVETHWEKINHIQGHRRSCKDGRGKITIISNPISTRWVTQKLDNNNTKEVLALLWRFYAPHQSSQPGGSSKKTGNPTWRTVGFDYRTSTELEETEGTNKILCTSRSNEESSDPTRDWDRLDCGCLRVFCGSVGQKWPAAGGGALAAAVLGGTYWHKSFLEVTNSPTIEPVDSRTEFTNSKQQTGLEHSPTHQQIIRLKIYWAWPCPTKQDSVLPTVSPSSEILPKPLLLIQQSVDRRSKNCNPTAYRTKISIAEI